MAAPIQRKTVGLSADAAENEARKQLNNLVLLFLNRGLSDAGLAIGTTVQKVRTTAAFNYTIDGEYKTKASTDDFWTLSGSNVADGYVQKWLLLIDAAGAASVSAGTAAKTAAGVVLPAVPDAKAVVGILQVQNASGSNFVPGTTALNAAGITATYTDGVVGLVSLVKDHQE